MEITATTYIDFLLKTDTSRVRAVREARRLYEEDYRPSTDFYGRLRDAIIEMHRTGGSFADLRKAIEDVPPRYRQHYGACIDGYRRWMGRKRFVWVRKPKVEVWAHGELSVRLNPELLLNVNGQPHRVKLYFKGPKFGQRRANLLIHLLLAGRDDGAQLAILDTRRGRMFTQTQSSPDFDLVLQAEALSFVAMWHGVGPAGARPATA